MTSNQKKYVQGRNAVGFQQVYLLQSYCERFCKIGIASNLFERLRAYKTSSPIPLVLLGVTVPINSEKAKNFEQRILQIYNNDRAGEWIKIEHADSILTYLAKEVGMASVVGKNIESQKHDNALPPPEAPIELRIVKEQLTEAKSHNEVLTEKVAALRGEAGRYKGRFETEREARVRSDRERVQMSDRLAIEFPEIFGKKLEYNLIP